MPTPTPGNRTVQAKPAAGTGAMPGKRLVRYSINCNAESGERGFSDSPPPGYWAASVSMELYATDAENAVVLMRQYFPILDRPNVTILSVARK